MANNAESMPRGEDKLEAKNSSQKAEKDWRKTLGLEDEAAMQTRIAQQKAVDVVAKVLGQSAPKKVERLDTKKSEIAGVAPKDYLKYVLSDSVSLKAKKSMITELALMGGKDAEKMLGDIVLQAPKDLSTFAELQMQLIEPNLLSPKPVLLANNDSQLNENAGDTSEDDEMIILPDETNEEDDTIILPDEALKDA